MKYTSLVFTLVIGFIVIAVPAFCAAYNVTDLGALPGPYSAYQANDAGQVASMFANGQAYVYTPGQGVVNIAGLTGATYCAPYAINNRGQVAGIASRSGSDEPAFLYTPGVGMVELPQCAPALVSMNNLGQVIAQGAAPHAGFAFVYTPGSGTAYIDVPNGSSYAAAINDLGQVVGNYKSSSTSNNRHPYIWSPSSGIVDLGTLGGDYGEAWTINNVGQVAGYSTLSGNTTSHIFLYTPGIGMTDLGISASTYSVRDMNDSAQIIGNIGTGSAQRGYVYTTGSGITVLDPLAGFVNSTVLHISDAGYIIGTSYNADGTYHVVRWDLVPEPSSLIALCAAMGGFGVMLRRKRA